MALQGIKPYQRPNDWAALVEAQSKANLMQEKADAELASLNKRLLRDELDRQLQEKEQQRRDEQMLREIEANLMLKKSKAIQDYDQRAKQEYKYMQQQLGQEYQDMSSYKAQLRAQMNQQEKSADKSWLNTLSNQMDRDNKMKRDLKEEKVRTEMEVLRLKEQQREYERQQRENERLRDQELIRQNIERVNLRDQKLMDFNKNLDEQRTNKAVVYDPVARENLEKEIKKVEVVNQWENEARRRAEEKMNQERERRMANKQETIQTLQQQLQEKNMKREMERMDFEREKQTIQRQVENTKSYETQLKFLRAKEKEEYKQVLENQSQNKMMQKYNELKMDEKEKQIFSPILTSNEDLEFKAVPGIHPRESPLQKAFLRAHRSFSQLPNPNSPTSRDPSPGGLSRNASNFGDDKSFAGSPVNGSFSNRKTSRNEFFFDPQKHDPIINPLGANIPRPGFGSTFQRGKGLSLLHVGSSITKL
ncbi:unnamed protein product [Blepharisma stoltei]|uniref:Trichohyalin-plectin-homology domain-containing protein n=1 Tax=Blepharisma stoltei TaxID=1481888 RepID=A0AAU9IC79_9CILI|nr:unnamed protein product [Blepharisma stoltei]